MAADCKRCSCYVFYQLALEQNMQSHMCVPLARPAVHNQQSSQCYKGAWGLCLQSSDFPVNTNGTNEG